MGVRGKKEENKEGQKGKKKQQKKKMFLWTGTTHFRRPLSLELLYLF